jgi:hypothetical protein
MYGNGCFHLTSGSDIYVSIKIDKSWKKNVISSKISITFDPVAVTYGGIGGRRWGNLVAF